MKIDTWWQIVTHIECQTKEYLRIFFFLSFFFYCCASIVVSIFPPPLSRVFELEGIVFSETLFLNTYKNNIKMQPVCGCIFRKFQKCEGVKATTQVKLLLLLWHIFWQFLSTSILYILDHYTCMIFILYLSYLPNNKFLRLLNLFKNLNNHIKYINCICYILFNHFLNVSLLLFSL